MKRGERRELKRDEMNIVSLTLRDFLGLSFQEIYIYLVIVIVIIHLNWFHFNNRGGNSEGGGCDTCPYIDTIYFTEN